MTEQKWILYQTTNICNDKIYVGVHKVADTSKCRKYLGSGKALKTAIEKYGRENFTRVTSAEFSCLKDAYLAEAELVTEEFCKLDSTYNMKVGGEGGIGVKHTDETKKRMSSAKKGRIISAETRAKISAACKGKLISEETKSKMSAVQKGRKISEEHRANIKIGHNTPEARANMSAAQKGKKLSEEHKLKIGAAKSGVNNHNFGKPCPDEIKAKISASCSIPVMIYGEYYKSIDKASKIKKVTYKTVFYRVKSENSKFAEWRYATPEEKAAHSLEVSRQST